MAEKKKKRKKRAAEDSLTPRQEAFCRYYAEICSDTHTSKWAVEAYRMAYNTEKQQYETIRVNANKLLRSTPIALRIQELQREEAERSRVDRAKIERVLQAIVSADPSDIYTMDEKTGKTRIKSPSQMPKHIRIALKSIKNNKGVVSYEFNGKTEAARLLGAWNGWNAPTQVEIGGSIKGELKIGFDEEE
jgi:phage terminase small subunit